MGRQSLREMPLPGLAQKLLFKQEMHSNEWKGVGVIKHCIPLRLWLGIHHFYYLLCKIAQSFNYQAAEPELGSWIPHSDSCKQSKPR